MYNKSIKDNTSGSYNKRSKSNDSQTNLRQQIKKSSRVNSYFFRYLSNKKSSCRIADSLRRKQDKRRRILRRIQEKKENIRNKIQGKIRESKSNMRKEAVNSLEDQCKVVVQYKVILDKQLTI